MNDILTQLKSNLVLIVLISGIISTWTMFSARLTNAESEIDQLSQVVVQINQINIKLAVIVEKVTNVEKIIDDGKK